MTTAEKGVKKIKNRLSPDERRTQKLERRIDSLEKELRKVKSKLK